MQQGVWQCVEQRAFLAKGAAALVLASADYAQQLGIKPWVRIVSTAVAGVDPAYMGLGPIPASRNALARAGLTAEPTAHVQCELVPARRTGPVPVNITKWGIQFIFCLKNDRTVSYYPHWLLRNSILLANSTSMLKPMANSNSKSSNFSVR